MAFNLMINTKCNSNCNFCFAKKYVNKKNSGLMSRADFNKVLVFLKSSKINTVTLMGGEPTLSKDFYYFIDRALDEGFDILILSNGLWPRGVRSFLATKPADRITFCFNINPYQPEEALKRSISNAHKMAKQAILSVNIDRTDIDFEFYLELLKKTGILKIRWSFSLPGTDNTYMTKSAQRKTIPALLKFFDRILTQGIEIIPDHLVTLCMFNEKQIGFMIKHKIKLKTICTPIIDILPNLDIINCFPLSDKMISYNLSQSKNPVEIVAKFRRNIDDLLDKHLPSKCRACKYYARKLCNGGCLAFRFTEDR